MYAIRSYYDHTVVTDGAEFLGRFLREAVGTLAAQHQVRFVRANNLQERCQILHSVFITRGAPGGIDQDQVV